MAAGSSRVRWRRALRAASPYLLALPAALLVAVFLYGVVTGVAQGFGIMPALGMTVPTLRFYGQALTRPDLSASVAYSAYLAAVSSAIALVGGIVLSAALSRMRAGRGLRLLALQIPIMSMHALVALAVMFVFSGAGLGPRALHALGLVSGPTDVGSVVGAPSGWGIILVYAWKEIPYVAFCTVTIMANISDSLGEAAATCGASRVQAFLHVTLPLCMGAALRAFIVVFLFALGSYEIPFLLGPTAPKALPVLAYNEFRDPDLVNRCYAMALNGLATLLSAIAAGCYFALLSRDRAREEGRHA